MVQRVQEVQGLCPVSASDRPTPGHEICRAMLDERCAGFSSSPQGRSSTPPARGGRAWVFVSCVIGSDEPMAAVDLAAARLGQLKVV